jgi:hypothetical protein
MGLRLCHRYAATNRHFWLPVAEFVNSCIDMRALFGVVGDTMKQSPSFQEQIMAGCKSVLADSLRQNVTAMADLGEKLTRWGRVLTEMASLSRGNDQAASRYVALNNMAEELRADLDAALEDSPVFLPSPAVAVMERWDRLCKVEVPGDKVDLFRMSVEAAEKVVAAEERRRGAPSRKGKKLSA